MHNDISNSVRAEIDSVHRRADRRSCERNRCSNHRDYADAADEGIVLISVKAAPPSSWRTSRVKSSFLRDGLHGHFVVRQRGQLRRRAHPEGLVLRDRGSSRCHRRGYPRLWAHLPDVLAEKPGVASSGLARSGHASRKKTLAQAKIDCKYRFRVPRRIHRGMDTGWILRSGTATCPTSAS